MRGRRFLNDENNVYTAVVEYVWKFNSVGLLILKMPYNNNSARDTNIIRKKKTAQTVYRIFNNDDELCKSPFLILFIFFSLYNTF